MIISFLYVFSLVLGFLGGWFGTGGVIENNTPKFLLGVALFAMGILMPIPAPVPM